MESLIAKQKVSFSVAVYRAGQHVEVIVVARGQREFLPIANDVIVLAGCARSDAKGDSFGDECIVDHFRRERITAAITVTILLCVVSAKDIQIVREIDSDRGRKVCRLGRRKGARERADLVWLEI